MATHPPRTGKVRPYTMMDNEEKSQIIEWYFVEKRDVKWICMQVGRAESTLYKFLKKFQSTTAISTQFLKAHSLALAEKVVKHATVEEAIEVLSRPNIGVLEPAKSGNQGAQVFISVGQDSVGSIAVSSTTNQKQLEGVHDAARTGSQISDEGRSAARIQGRVGRGSEEHEDGFDSHPGRVQGGRRTFSDDEAPQGEPEEVIEDPRKKRRRPRVNSGAPLIQFGDPKTRSRVAIPNKRRAQSSIHLRYDIVEP